jgi:short-subunit dehydrogenase involved in D-alanine esterification of teichoic acids
MHSLCVSLKLQFKDKGLHVIEIIPPFVNVELALYDADVLSLHSLVESELHDSESKAV